MHRPKGERLPLDLPVTLYGPDRRPLPARFKDISRTGAAVVCLDCPDLTPPDPVELWLSLRQDGTHEPLHIGGLVARSDGPLVGIRFLREASRLVQRLRRGAAGRATPALHG